MGFARRQWMIFTLSRSFSKTQIWKSSDDYDLFPPKAVYGMKHLNRELFAKTVQVPSLKVESKFLRSLTKSIKLSKFKMRNIKPVAELSKGDPMHETHKLLLLNPKKYKTSEDFSTDETKLLEKCCVDVKTMLFCSIDVGYDNWTVAEILKAVLPVEAETVSGYHHIGHIAQLNLKPEVMDYKHLIGTMDSFNNNSSVAVMTEEMLMAEQVAHILEYKITPVVCCVGLMLNILNILVLTELDLKESPYVYLRALSVTDFSALLMAAVFLLVTEPPDSSGYISSDGSSARDFGIFYGAYIFFPLNSICNNASTWLVMTLTIERLMFVKHPLWARNKCSSSSAKVKVIAIVLVTILLNVPRFLMYRVAPESNIHPRLQLKPTAFRYSATYRALSWVYTFAFGVVPILVMCVTNAYLIYAVKLARRRRKTLNLRNNMEQHWNREQTRLTLTLIAIVCLAIACILPAAFGEVMVLSSIYLRSSVLLKKFLATPFYRVFRSLANMLLICNMSLNFILYSAFNDKFVRVMRKMFKRWMLCCRKKRATIAEIVIARTTIEEVVFSRSST